MVHADEVQDLAHMCRVIAAEDALISLLREFNATSDEKATGISIELDAEGHGDLTYMRGAFPLAGESL